MIKKYFLLFLLLCTGYALPQSSTTEITTQLKEKFTDKNGKPLTGKGVLVGDVDSGIDVFHPMFFFADGGEYKWIDVDNDGILTPGTDAVDLNRNRKADKNEIINFLKIKDNTGLTISEKYDPSMDVLYADLNNNHKRDYGEKDGFLEKDPTYGEQLFIAIDANKNNIIDKGEKFIALKTSKIKAVREKDGTIRRRGNDLIKTKTEDAEHGTGVLGIILGGTADVQKLHGIAPDAEAVISAIKYDHSPRYVKNFPEHLNFLKDERSDIILIEDGEWGWESMDGSTPEEQMMTQFTQTGTIVITAAGNLAGGKMHIKDTLSAGIPDTYSFTCPASTPDNMKNDGIFISFLWLQDADISYTLETPDKAITELTSDGLGYQETSSYKIYYSKEKTSKGTNIFKIGISKIDSGAVPGIYKITAVSNSDVVIDSYLSDVSQQWAYVIKWRDHLTDESTIVFPATAEGVITVAAYTVNNSWNDIPGDIASYSGRGTLINGKLGIDITAPGHTTYTTAPGFSYQVFSGTSSALPHVVGAAALLLQYDHSLKQEDIRRILINSAVHDKFTGDVPNTSWGYGKLNIENAIKYLMAIEKH